MLQRSMAGRKLLCGLYSMQAAQWRQQHMKFVEPIIVEAISAHAGLDIGQTLIGMHLKRVAVPVRLSESKIGEAVLTAAWTRPPLIGGERAKYPR